MSKLSKLVTKPGLFLIDFFQKRIDQNFGFFYRCAGNIFAFVAQDSYRRTWTEKLMRLAYVSGKHSALSHIFFKSCRTFEPSLWAVTYYISKAVNNGETKHLVRIIENSRINREHLPLMKSALFRAKGAYDEALHTLDFQSASKDVRYKMAQAERSIYHIVRDREGMAVSALRFIISEPDMVLMEYALNAAGAAETAGRRDIMTICLRRALDDIKKIMASKRLFKQYWREAIKVSLRLYHIEDALMIAKKAKSLGLRKARQELSHIEAICTEVSSWRWAVNAARRAVQAAAKGKFPDYKGKVIVVLHSAAFSRNDIDYAGFRGDVRFCYAKIISILMTLCIKPKITFKLSTHGKVLYTSPYFSYHTISDDKLGCHFKETDRPSSFCFDHSGYSGWSEFSGRDCEHSFIKMIDPLIAEQFFNSEKAHILGNRISKYKQPATDMTRRLPEKYIFIGLQMQCDSVQELAYYNIAMMIDEVCTVAKENNLNVVVKRHPYCRAGSVANFLAEGEKTGKFIVDSGNIHELAENSEAVCVINSAVGSEALLHEKPVYVFGRSEYMAACFVCRNPGDFKKNFQLKKHRLDSETLKKFWYALKNIYATNLSNEEAAEAFIKNKVLEHLLLNQSLLEKCNKKNYP